jgi:predicted TIM-barrel fold metal-dependent hydrolase
MNFNRRGFLKTVAVSAALPSLRATPHAAPEDLWGGPVLDLHFHMRRTPEQNVAHLDGCGVSNANLLTSAAAADRVRDIQTQFPGRFIWFASADITKPEAEQQLTAAVKAGAGGFGEIKFHVAADGPELRRMYSLAADLDVPILVHFQEVPHTPTEGVFSTGFRNFEAVLKAYPKTRFFGHADAFWANISAGYANDVAYPDGPIKPGGITDKLLGDYPNLYGDLSANSGNNALSRDPAFTVEFLKRHRNKLMFGSDCSCTDGKGAGISQAGNPAAARLAGKCVARETLTVLKRSTTPEMFRQITWDNVHKNLRLKV